MNKEYKPKKEEWRQCLQRTPQPCSGILHLTDEITYIEKRGKSIRENFDNTRQRVSHVQSNCHACRDIKAHYKERFDHLPCVILYQDLSNRLNIT